jgi:peptidoglycan/xylan/chitin deacetylase (PgdA/CDA1 family)
MRALSRLGPAFDALAGRLASGPFMRVAPPRLAVLAYHGISDPACFARQVGWLRCHTHLVGLDDVIAAAHGGPLPRRAVLITFDDADRTLVEHAVPTLVHHGAPAVAFAVAGLVGTDVPFWWDEVGALAPPGANVASMVRELKSVPNDERLARVEALRLTTHRAPVRAEHLSPDQLAGLEAGGVEIGSHSLTHPCLDRCTEDEIAAEAAGSRAILAAALGHPIRAFAYPNGDTDPRVRSAVAAAGYEVAFLFDHRRSPARPPDPLAISRLRVDSDTSLDRLRAIVSGIHPALHHARGGA